jgi:hypothetical protein
MSKMLFAFELSRLPLVAGDLDLVVCNRAGPGVKIVETGRIITTTRGVRLTAIRKDHLQLTPLLLGFGLVS